VRLHIIETTTLGVPLKKWPVWNDKKQAARTIQKQAAVVAMALGTSMWLHQSPTAKQPCNAARTFSAVEKLDTAEITETANRNSSDQQKLQDILHAERLVGAKKFCDWDLSKFTMAMPSNKDGTDSGGNGSCGNRCNGTNVVATKAVAAAKHHVMRQCTACSQISVPHILVLPIDF